MKNPNLGKVVRALLISVPPVLLFLLLVSDALFSQQTVAYMEKRIHGNTIITRILNNAGEPQVIADEQEATVFLNEELSIFSKNGERAILEKIGIPDYLNTKSKCVTFWVKYITPYGFTDDTTDFTKVNFSNKRRDGTVLEEKTIFPNQRDCVPDHTGSGDIVFHINSDPFIKFGFIPAKYDFDKYGIDDFGGKRVLVRLSLTVSREYPHWTIPGLLLVGLGILWWKFICLIKEVEDFIEEGKMP